MRGVRVARGWRLGVGGGRGKGQSRDIVGDDIEGGLGILGYIDAEVQGHL